VASRREFLTSFNKLNKEDVVEILRPPYAKSQSIFQSECIKCLDKACEASCDEQIIVIEDDSPIISFAKSGCTFCEECANSCDNGVLDLENISTSDRLNAKFVISTKSCIAHNGVVCFSCKEPCIDNAILFNGLFNPVIDDNLCTACGFCIARCPTEAISYSTIHLNPIEEIIT